MLALCVDLSRAITSIVILCHIIQKKTCKPWCYDWKLLLKEMWKRLKVTKDVVYHIRDQLSLRPHQRNKESRQFSGIENCITYWTHSKFKDHVVILLSYSLQRFSFQKHSPKRLRKTKRQQRRPGWVMLNYSKIKRGFFKTPGLTKASLLLPPLLHHHHSGELHV